MICYRLSFAANELHSLKSQDSFACHSGYIRNFSASCALTNVSAPPDGDDLARRLEQPQSRMQEAIPIFSESETGTRSGIRA